jgi:peptide/nickel transport system substrate-binding protein
LRFIARSDLRVLDPIWTTAYVTRNHGYMVFDTLFALDSKFNPRPQMVGDYHTSPDGLSYRFTLRDGLQFHDGRQVRGADCVASLRRWMERDALGQTFADAVDDMTAGGDNDFTIRLKERFPLLLDALAKVSSLTPFMMPERLAKTDPYQQITEVIGSGPFKFVAEEFELGHKAVYVKNTEYVPRNEPADWASGGKVVKIDRVEWLYMPDHMTAAAALGNGEVDWWEEATLDLLPLLAANPDITIKRSDPLGSMAFLRFNYLHPPFDNVRIRQAVLAVVDQADFLSAFAGDRRNWNRCASFFPCGTPMANDAGSTALTGRRDFDKAKRLIAEAGYNGERIVILDGVDQRALTCRRRSPSSCSRNWGSMSNWRQATGAPSLRGEPRKSWSMRVAGTFTLPTGPAPMCSTHRSMPDCAAMASLRPGSAGLPTKSSRSCVRSGSKRVTMRHAGKWRRSSKNGPLRPSPISRQGNGIR